MRILCMSDLHGHLPRVDKLPDANLVLLGGDYCRDHTDRLWYETVFAQWVGDIARRGMPVCSVAGNHDKLFQDEPTFPRSRFKWAYLEDDGIDLNGVKIWGSPWQPTYGYGWAFNLDEPQLAAKWELIPVDTQILLLHGPPHGYGDFSPYGKVHTGSPSLLARIEQVKPRLVVNGHIHSGYGIRQIGDTVVVNASLCDERYTPSNDIIVVEI